jgi:Tfp pilus assembly protein PilW
MSKSVIIKLTTAGTSTGPFSLLSNYDSYVTPFETNITKTTLVTGYTSSLVPDTATIIRVLSSGSCTNHTDLTIVPTTTTTTTTTSTTTTTTTVAFATFSVRTSVSALTVCAQTPQTVYTAFGNTIITGTSVFTNTFLTLPLLGADFIVDVLIGDIYNISSGNGQIGSAAGNC